MVTRPPVLVCAECGRPAIGMTRVRRGVKRSACAEHGAKPANKWAVRGR